jgi:hypothetical protein
MASAGEPAATYRAVSARPRVNVVFDGRLASPTLEALALKEAALIWTAYGVDIGTPGSPDCGPDNRVTITVTFDNGPDRRRTPGSLGSIRFLDGAPEPAIALYPHTIANLVSVAPAGSVFFEAPGVIRDLVLGRVLGRAMAHEIGHFLLRSQHHSPVGLMRALQPTTDLVDPDRHRFGLSPNDVTRLVAMTSSFPQPSRSHSCAS